MSSLPQTTQEYVLIAIDKGSHNLKLQEFPLSKLKANEVLVKVHAVSLQYRDLAIIFDIYPVGKPSLVPCSDMAGEVVSVGEDVKHWKVGDRVCSNFATDHLDGDPTDEIINTSLGGQITGVLTQYRNLPAHALVRIPDHLSYEQAATLPCAALTAYNALHGPNPVKAGDTVLVQGTGGVSMFALQLAVAAGATVIATSSSNEKLEVAAQHGAKHLINYKDTPAWDEEARKITNNRGVDHIIEVGGQDTLGKSINAARIGGSIHVIGFLTGTDAIPMENVVLPTITKSLLIRGICVGSVAQFKNLVRAIEANPAQTVPIIDKVFEFEDAVAAYAHLESQKHIGKVVIRVAN